MSTELWPFEHRGELLAGSRRDFLRRCGMGMGTLGLMQLLGGAAEGVAPVSVDPAHPMAARRPPLPAKARRVVHFFLNGGPSHIDTFDPKPELVRWDGRPLPLENLRTERKTGAAFATPFEFRPRGQSGLEISDLFERLARHADDLCVVRSMQANLPNHEPSLMLMNCGEQVMSRPSVGAWVTYGLGSENQNLPGFIAMCPGGYPIKGTDNWQSGFLPGVYQGTYIDSQHRRVEDLIEHIRSPHAPVALQRRQLELLQKLNRDHQSSREGDGHLEARIQSFELAFRMQMEAAEAFDIGGESEAIREAYGDTTHGRQTLIARRLLERGVRYVQLWHGAGQPWDSHEGLEGAHRKLAGEIDRPIGALLDDLKQRGMFEDTLVVIGGEFGRTPVAELVKGKPGGGRDHNPYGFSMVLAGGGVKGGYAHGATDEFGFRAVENPVHVHDLHATMLHLLGFDHERFTFRYAGRDFRLTDVRGKVVRELLA
ncbi:MAG: hypothetical protein RI897_2142 [Verrucomicrobiota bacterium]